MTAGGWYPLSLRYLNMRLPLTPPLSTKDGVSAKNARLTNCLKESKKTGDKAVIRPGLVLDAQASGVGNGLVSFNGELVSVYGATLLAGVQPIETAWVTASGIGFYAYVGMTYGGGKYALVGDGGNVAYSSDGITWAYGSGLTAGYHETIAYGLGVFCTVSTNTSSVGIASSSTDGVTWTSRTISNRAWRKVVFGNGIFIATPFSGTACATSTNGTSWTERTAPSGTWVGAWNGSVFGFVGIGKWATTTDGVTWNSGNMPAVDSFYSIATNGSRFVTISNPGEIYYSDDGENWTFAEYLGGTNRCVLYADGYFWNFAGTTAARSADGVVWDISFESLPNSANWYAAASNGTEIVVAPNSSHSGIRRSVDNPNIVVPSLSVNAMFDFAQSPL